jgi:hypothetical protein
VAPRRGGGDMMFGGAGRGGIVSLCHEKGDLGLSYELVLLTYARSMHTIHSTSTTLLDYEQS